MAKNFYGPFSRLLKSGASRRDPALRGFCKCSHMTEYAAVSKTPHALADGPMLVFQHPVRSDGGASGLREMLPGRVDAPLFRWAAFCLQRCLEFFKTCRPEGDAIDERIRC